MFVILESWSSDNIETLGGLPGITPQFKKLEKDGDLSEDQSRDEQEKIQKETDNFINDIEKKLSEKEAEILKV